MDLLVWFLGIGSIRSLSTVIGLDGECVLFMGFTIHWFLGPDQSLTCSFVEDHSFKRHPCPMDPEATDFTWHPQVERKGRRKSTEESTTWPLASHSLIFFLSNLHSPFSFIIILLWCSCWFPRSSSYQLLQTDIHDVDCPLLETTPTARSLAQHQGKLEATRLKLGVWGLYCQSTERAP